jgi:hypothetical protein
LILTNKRPGLSDLNPRDRAFYHPFGSAFCTPVSINIDRMTDVIGET